MKSTLADIKQLFNVKSIAYNTNINALAEGQFGVFAEDSDVSVVSGTTFATLPQKFRIVSRLNGKIYYSFDTIDKSRMFNKANRAYQSEQINIWQGVVEHCNCMNGVKLHINIDEQSLIQRDGLTWTHSDFVVIVSPEELACFCGCPCEDLAKKTVYENNVLTQLLVEKVVAINSPFYTARVTVPVTSATTYATVALMNAATGMEAGDLAITTSTSALYVYDGAAWVVTGTSAGALTNVGAFVQANKARNTDDDETNEGPLLALVIEGKTMGGGTYNDLDVNYVYPRGVKLQPSFLVNNEKAIAFTEVQALRFEIGAGYDLRAEEWENMNYYTDLNYYPRLSDGIQSGNLVYQFEGGNYNTINFEFGSEKSGLEDVPEGNYKKFGVLFGTTSTPIYNELVTMFIG